MKLRFAAGRLLALVRKRRLDAELEGEILAHLEMAELDAISAGLSLEEARRGFGGIEQMKEDHRDRRSARRVENVLRDVRYGMASLARDPGFAAVTIGLLALGIGANTAMFSIVDAVLLKPLPFPEPERMVRLWETPTATQHNNTTTLTFLDWKRKDALFEALSLEESFRAAVATGADPERLSGKLVSADYFNVFGVKARIGRTFAPGEDQPGAAPVVVLSHSLWQTQFGGDPDILKRALELDGESHRIIGVLPAGSFDRDEARFWKPLIFSSDQLNRRQHWLHVVGRLRSHVSIGQVQARMSLLRASLAGVIPQKDWGFACRAIREDTGGGHPPPLDLPCVRSGSAGVADRLRECGEPGAGQRSHPAEGDGRQGRFGRAVGFLSGAMAVSFRKGSRPHALAGKVFGISMLSMSASGVYMAAVKNQPGNVLGGALTFYLVATAWMSARRRDLETGIFDWGALLVALAIGGVNVTFGVEAQNSETGLKYGYEAGNYYFLGSVALLGAAGDIRILAAAGISGARRIARHLWRMCFALFIAAASIFLARAHLFPALLCRTGALLILSFLPLVLMIFWLVRIRITKEYRTRPLPRGEGPYPLPT